jgi:hypothetical protein
MMGHIHNSVQSINVRRRHGALPQSGSGDLQLANAIFDMFQGARGLGCNVAKCQFMPICCTDDQVALAQQLFPYPVTDFLIKYLGIPLCTSKLLKVAFQPLIDKMTDKLPTWRGRLMHCSGRLTLIKTTLAAISVYSAISHAFPSWVLKAFTNPSWVLKAFTKIFHSLSMIRIRFSSWRQMSRGVGQSAMPARAWWLVRSGSQANGARLAPTLALVQSH